MALSHNDLHNGVKIELDGEPFNITDSEFVKPGKGTAFTRIKAKSLFSGRVIEKTFKASDKIDKADIHVTQMEYLYSDGTSYFFMDPSSYEQIELDAGSIGEADKWLKENTVCEIMFYNGKPVSATPPNFLILKIEDTEAAVRGDTVSGVTKKARLETGAEVEVPQFIEAGELIKVDTREGGRYVERAKEE